LKFYRIAVSTSVLLLAACATQQTRVPAPIVEHTQSGVSQTAPVAASSRPTSEYAGKTYTVKPGDTLYSIALENGLDYKEIAAWNQLADVNLIKVGQVLRLSDGSAPAASDAPGIEVHTLKPGGGTQAAASAGVQTVSYPKAIKLPYNTDTAAVTAQAEGTSQPAASVSAAAVAAAKPDAPAPAPKPAAEAATAAVDEDLNWEWPAVGKTLTPFSDSNKGIDISGKMGQPVLAAAAGRVVYAGSGLRGYGKLVIIKHNKTYLSAYAHNSQLLVKEGDSVKKGDKIAEMGNTDADKVELHFEIRKFGKPIDPTKLLAAG
jgi:lipoprotein NlpD